MVYVLLCYVLLNYELLFVFTLTLSISYCRYNLKPFLPVGGTSRVVTVCGTSRVVILTETQWIQNIKKHTKTYSKPKFGYIPCYFAKDAAIYIAVF